MEVIIIVIAFAALTLKREMFKRISWAVTISAGLNYPIHERKKNWNHLNSNTLQKLKEQLYFHGSAFECGLLLDFIGIFYCIYESTRCAQVQS